MFLSFAAAAGGGRAIAVKPTLTHHTTIGQFRITNYDQYDPTVTFNLSVTAGTATRSTNIITLSAVDSICTVTARLPKSVSNSTAATAERKEYDAVEGPQEEGYLHALPPHGVNVPTTIGARWVICTDSGGGTGSECAHREGTMIKGSLPSGYTDSYGEWWKVS